MTISKYTLFSLLTSFILFACGTEPTKTRKPPSKPIQISIQNISTKIIDSIDMKPCGSSAKHYRVQATSIKPQEKIVLEIYQYCADLVALDGFGSKLDQLANLHSNSSITWKIR